MSAKNWKLWLLSQERAVQSLAAHPERPIASVARIYGVAQAELQDWLDEFNGGSRKLTAARIAQVKVKLGILSAATRPAAEPKAAGPTGMLHDWLAGQGVKPRADIISYQIEVTPPLATAWLTLNQGNRNPSKAKIRRFAAAIKAGRWALNGESIKFSSTGRLLDGQSRLRAIIEAGVPAVLEIRGGLPDIAQQSMDVGEARKGAHTLEMLGEKYPAILSPSLKMLWQHERGSLGWSRFGGTQVLENMDIAPLLARHPELKASVGWVMTQGVKLEALMASSSAAFFHYVFGQANRVARDAFFNGLATGLGLTSSSPVYHLRERLLSMRADGMHRAQPIILRGLVIKAWNAYRAGARITGLDFKKGEQFPAIVGAKGGK